MPTPLQQFIGTVSNLATKLGFTDLVIVVRDPADRAVKFFAGPGVLDSMKPEIAAKVGADASSDEATTGWEG